MVRVPASCFVTVALSLVLLLPIEADAAPARAPAPTESRFTGAITPIPPRVRVRMTSWRPGCPVHWRALRLVRATHLDLAGRQRQGRLIVHRVWAGRVLGVLRELHAAGVSIERMELPERYGSDDQAIMRANATSAFNCRVVAGTRRWSEHAYGRAIDINPIQNPYVSGRRVSPLAGRAFADRAWARPGMLRDGDVTVAAFARIGWEWGGHWRGARDYMHFSATGR